MTNQFPTLQNQIVDRIGSRKMTRGEYAAAFDRVVNPDNWKAPIDATITVAGDLEMEVVLRAIEFFTGARGRASLVVSRNSCGGPFLYRFQAPGYYLTCGA